MGSGIVTVGRKEYAVGLYWENSPSSRVVLAAKEAASQPGQQADFYAVRAGQKDGHVPQFGLGQSAAGHKSGMPAFAGCLANQQLGSWAGAFRLREGTVVTVVRDDLIVPDGDQLYADENEARERLLQEISFGGLQRTYAPESWSIPGSDNMPISLLLDERRDVTLQSVKTPKAFFIAGSVVLVLLAGGLGIGWYLQDQAAKQDALAMERMAALQRAKAQANHMIPGMGPEQPPYPPPERKWEEAPQPLAIVESCRSGLPSIPAAVAGWRLTQIKCDGNALSLTWNREKGFSAPPANWILDDGGTSAVSSIPLPHLTVRGHEDLQNPADNTRRYLMQNWPGTLAHMQDDPPPPPPPDYKGPWNPPLPPWVKRSFTLTVPNLPSDLPTYFDNLPGLVMKTISFAPGANIVGGTWTVEGIIYENRM